MTKVKRTVLLNGFRVLDKNYEVHYYVGNPGYPDYPNPTDITYAYNRSHLEVASIFPYETPVTYESRMKFFMDGNKRVRKFN